MLTRLLCLFGRHRWFLRQGRCEQRLYWQCTRCGRID